VKISRYQTGTSFIPGYTQVGHQRSADQWLAETPGGRYPNLYYKVSILDYPHNPLDLVPDGCAYWSNSPLNLVSYDDEPTPMYVIRTETDAHDLRPIVAWSPSKPRYLWVSDFGYHPRGVQWFLRNWPALQEMLRPFGYVSPPLPPVTDCPEITIGADPEYELWHRRTCLVAEGIVNDSTSDPIGVDGAGCQVELRPEPGTPAEVTHNLKSLLLEFNGDYPSYALSTKGDVYPLGGHIHVGLPNEFRQFTTGLRELCDAFIGTPTIGLSGRARHSYRQLGAYETKPWGWEYRTPPAGIFATPPICRTTLSIMHAVVTAHIMGEVETDPIYEPSLDAEVPSAEAFNMIGIAPNVRDTWVKRLARLRLGPWPSTLQTWGAWTRQAPLNCHLVRFLHGYEWAEPNRSYLTRLLQSAQPSAPIVIGGTPPERITGSLNTDLYRDDRGWWRLPMWWRTAQRDRSDIRYVADRIIGGR
jgi:hypothetical protein